MAASFSLLVLTLLLLASRPSRAVRVRGDWWTNWDAKDPPQYLQPPWALAPSMSSVKLPEAPKAMPPPPAPEVGFVGVGKFYPPPPAPPPSPPPPLPPPPPAPAAQFPEYKPVAPRELSTPNVVGFREKRAEIRDAPRFASRRLRHRHANEAARPHAVAADAAIAAAAALGAARPTHHRTHAHSALPRSAAHAALPAGKQLEEAMLGNSHATVPHHRSPRVHADHRRRLRGDSLRDAAAAMRFHTAATEKCCDTPKATLQWQYFDANNPPPWLQPTWGSQPRHMTPQPMSAAVPYATPLAYTMPPNAQYFSLPAAAPQG